MNNHEDFKQLALNMSVVVDHLEQRCQKAIHLAEQASLNLQKTLDSVQHINAHLQQQALAQFEKNTQASLNNGFKQPLANLNQQVNNQVSALEIASQRLSQSMQSNHRLFILNNWKVFAASLAILSTALIYSAYTVKQARTEIARAEWVGQINSAITKGKITSCSPDGGLCANINGKAYRLDQ